MKVWLLLILAACQGTGAPAAAPPSKARPPVSASAPSPTPATPAPPAAVSAKRMIAASGVRLRERPSVDAPEVARLSIGTVVDELARSPEKVQIGGESEHWYQVRAAAGQEGWVFGVVTSPVEAGGEDAARVKLAERRLGVQDAPFADRVDLYNMLQAAAGSAQGPAKAEFELLRLLAIRHVLDTREVSGAPAAGVAEWARGLGPWVAHDEISASWLLKADTLWSLSEQNAGNPVGERAAWEASQSPMGGECEGDASCVLMRLDRAEGRYLRAWPNGAHTAQAVAVILQTAGEPYVQQGVAETPKEYAKELRDTLASLTKAVESSPATEPRTKALQALKDLTARVR